MIKNEHFAACICFHCILVVGDLYGILTINRKSTALRLNRPLIYFTNINIKLLNSNPSGLTSHLCGQHPFVIVFIMLPDKYS